MYVKPKKKLICKVVDCGVIGILTDKTDNVFLTIFSRVNDTVSNTLTVIEVGFFAIHLFLTLSVLLD